MDADTAKHDGLDPLWTAYLAEPTHAGRNAIAERQLSMARGAAIVWSRKTGMDVEDLNQDAAMALMVAVETWRPGRGTKFRMWAYSCIRNRMIQRVEAVAFRKKCNQPLPRMIDGAGDIRGNDGEAAIDTRMSVEARRVEDSQFLVWLVERMPVDKNLRLIAHLRYIDGFTATKIAELVGMSRGNMSWRLIEIRRRMRRAAKAAGIWTVEAGLLRKA